MDTMDDIDTRKDEGRGAAAVLAALKAYDWGGDRGALMCCDELIVSAKGDERKLAEIEQALIEVLDTDAKLPAKEYACRQLALIGTGRCVPAVAGMLPDAKLSDCARFALEAIPDRSADDALRAALTKTEGDVRVGIVNTLGERRDKEAIPALRELRDSSDKTMATAAADALRKIVATE